MPDVARRLLDVLLSLAELELLDDVEIVGSDPIFPVPYHVADAGSAALAAVAAAVSSLSREGYKAEAQSIKVAADAAAASLRSYYYLRNEASEQEPDRRAFLGSRANIIRTRDRWIYLHREFTNHRAIIAKVLGCEDKFAAITAAALQWDAAKLEDAVFEAGACAAVIRSRAEWSELAQAKAIDMLPLLEITKVGDSPVEPCPGEPRPLSGVRVLDLTRVLAGPTAARSLAEYGADVLRIGNTRLPNVESQMLDTGHGKRSAALDLDDPADVEMLKQLIKGADVFSQSYRPGSLAARGFSMTDVANLRPGIIYLSLSAFGHEGPWCGRRGFDTVVQACMGVADEFAEDGHPRLLPVSALDYISGYLMAFGAIVALQRRSREGGSYHVQVSLAQTARWLLDIGTPDNWQAAPIDLEPSRLEQLTMTSETPLGRFSHLKPVAQLSRTPAFWEKPTVPLDHDLPAWLPRD